MWRNTPRNSSVLYMNSGTGPRGPGISLIETPSMAGISGRGFLTIKSSGEASSSPLPPGASSNSLNSIVKGSGFLSYIFGNVLLSTIRDREIECKQHNPPPVYKDTGHHFVGSKGVAKHPKAFLRSCMINFGEGNDRESCKSITQCACLAFRSYIYICAIAL